MPYAPSELILNADHSVYHLGLRAEDVPDVIFTVGDPDRVEDVSRHFEQVLWTKKRREFTIVRGQFRGRDVLVLSTGMGTDNIDIVINELDAAVNIDPLTREDRPQQRKLTLIRIGTSGAIDPDIPLGTHLYSGGALSFDGLLPFYQHDFPQLAVEGAPLQPYYIKAPNPGVQGIDVAMGITATLPGFYAPQGRNIRTKSTFTSAMDGLYRLQHEGMHVTNFEMETAGIYAMATLLGHEAYSFSALLANRTLGTFHDQPAEAIDGLIQKVLAWASTLE